MGAKYQVLQPIEKNNVMFLPKGASAEKVPSAGHGRLIPVDASGEIELSEQEASSLVYGQVPLFQGKPDPVGGAEVREDVAKKAADDAAAKAAEEAEGREEILRRIAERNAKAAKKK